MKIFWGADKRESHPHTIVIGNFDGFHLGHIQLLKKAGAIKPSDEFLGVVTFYPHPETILRYRDDDFSLSTLDEKIEIFEKLKCDTVFFIEFTHHFADLSPGDFIAALLDMVNVRRVVIGKNFRFGKKGIGTPDFMQKILSGKKIPTSVEPLLEKNGIPISSTLIRNCVFDRQFEEAESYLGRKYIISGTVMHGRGLGKQIGFPTANLDVQGKLLPRPGVYYGITVYADKSYFSLIFIGKPSISFSEKNVMEIWMDDFTGDLYGETLKVNIRGFIRPVKKVSGKEELRKLIVDDLNKARNAF